MHIKSMLFAAVAAVSLACAAREYPTNDVSIATREEFFSLVDELCAVEPGVRLLFGDRRFKGYSKSVRNIMFGTAPDGTNVVITAEEAAAVESRLAAAGVTAVSQNVNTENCMRYYAQAKGRMPILAALCREHAMKVFPTLCKTYDETGVYRLDKLPYAVRNDVVVEAVTNAFTSMTHEQFAYNLKLVVPRQVKVYLRSQGKSFVTKDGVNPLESYAKRLETALNAPRYAGLKELVTEIGLPGLCPDDKWFISDEKARETMDDIMVGDKKLGTCAQRDLRTALGTAAYNEFVRQYNEGTAK